jgi:CRISPR system Cascade subunit CasA
MQPPTSENGEIITPSDVHALTVYWSMPERQWMHFEKNNTDCDIYGHALRKKDSEGEQTDSERVSTYGKLNKGGNYKGLWLHPLSPVQEGRTTQSLSSAKLPETALGYHLWLGIVQTVADKSIAKKPALAIDYLLNTAKYVDRATTRWQFVQKQEQQRNQHQQELKDRTTQTLSDITIWTFGLDNDSAKINAWLDSQIPIIYVSGEYRNDFEMTVEDMILASEKTAQKLKTAFTTATKRQSSSVASNATLANAVEERFWRFTENEFYQRLQNLKEALEKEQPDTGCIEKTKQDWRKYVRGKAESIFLASLTPSHLRSNPKQYISGMKELKK